MPTVYDIHTLSSIQKNETSTFVNRWLSTVYESLKKRKKPQKSPKMKLYCVSP